MTATNPDLFLASKELTAWAGPHVVTILEPTQLGALARIDPAGPDGSTEIELRPRYAETRVVPPSEWPLYVNILDAAGTLVGVGALYATADEAETAAKVGLTW